MKKDSKINPLKKELGYSGVTGTLVKANEKLLLDSIRYRRMVRKEVMTAGHIAKENRESAPSSDEFRAIVDWNTFLSRRTLSKRDGGICFLTHLFYPESFGGTERFVLEQAKAAKKNGREVLVFTYSKNPVDSFQKRMGNLVYNQYMYDGVRVIAMRKIKPEIGFYYKNITLDDPEIMRFANRMFRKYKIGLVHSCYGQIFGSFLTTCKNMNIPYFLTLTNYDLFCHSGLYVQKSGVPCSGSCEGRECQKKCKEPGVQNCEIRFKKAKRILRDASEIFVPSEYAKRRLENEVNGLNVSVCPHGVDEEKYTYRPRREIRRFAYVGKYTRWKGCDEPIRAMRSMQGDLELIVVGSGDPFYHLHLKQLALGNKKVRFAKPIAPEKMAAFYKSIDCVIVPSRAPETYNYVLTEALASGCIAVVSSLGAPSERVLDGINGYHYISGDEHSLKQAILRAAHHEPKKSCMVPKAATLSQESAFYERQYKKYLR